MGVNAIFDTPQHMFGHILMKVISLANKSDKFLCPWHKLILFLR